MPPSSTPAFSFGGTSFAAPGTGFSFGSGPSASTGVGATSSAPAFGGSTSLFGSSTAAQFSFSGSTTAATNAFSATPAGKDTATDATAATPATAAGISSFSFGIAPSSAAPASSNATATTVQPATTTPAFSFSQTAASLPSAGTTTSASTGVASTSAATASPAFGFAAGSAGAAFSSTAVAPPQSTGVLKAVPAPTALPASPSAVQGQEVDDVINEWTAELERRSRAFMKHAETLAQWDRVILGNRHALLALEENLRRVLGGQDALERRLQMLEAHQKGIHDVLSGMEGEAERLYREERPLADDETVERDILYERAERVGALLMRIGEQLSEAIGDVNQVTVTNLGEGTAPLGKLVRVLNNQLDALMQLDAQTEELASKVNAMQKDSSR